jgi:CBS domain-containing protein
MKSVRQLMKENVLQIDTDEEIKNAAKIMRDKKIGCLVVIEDEKPVGLITERDVVFKVVAEEKPITTKIRDIMSPKLISIGPDENVDQASIMMKKHGIKKLPVISFGKIVGIITSTDIAHEQPKLLDEYRKLLIVNE